MKLTFIGLRMRRSCWMIRFDTETISGLVGCAEADIGVSSWPWVKTLVLWGIWTFAWWYRKWWFRYGCRSKGNGPWAQCQSHLFCHRYWKCLWVCLSLHRISELARQSMLRKGTKKVDRLWLCWGLEECTPQGYWDWGNDMWSMGATQLEVIRCPFTNIIIKTLHFGKYQNLKYFFSCPSLQLFSFKDWITDQLYIFYLMLSF